MKNFADDLKDCFDGASFFYNSAWEYDPNGKKEDGTARDCTEFESKMIDIFDRLSETVEAIPPDISRDAEALSARLPESFEEILQALIDHVGAEYKTGGFFEPSNAGEFVKKLIEYVKLREIEPTLFSWVTRRDLVA